MLHAGSLSLAYSMMGKDGLDCVTSGQSRLFNLKKPTKLPLSTSPSPIPRPILKASKCPFWKWASCERGR
eukprot:6180418-Pleurochrysis_carterae.AAC.1